ncbi:MAG: S41 family peptidase [Christensenellales bacterium]
MNEENKKTNKSLAAFILGVVLTLITIFAIAKIGNFVVVHGDENGVIKTIAKEYSNLPKILDTIDKKSIFEFNEKNAKDAALKAVVDSIGDEYSEYLTKKETDEWESYLNGEFSGIGISFQKNDKGEYQVTEVFKDSPAEKSGIKIGDIILKVDGNLYKTSEEMSEHIRGESGTTVELILMRDNKEIKASITRETVKEKTVYAKVMDDGSGYIVIKSFEDGTAKEFETELSAFEKQGIKSMVIDLRDNGGGYIDEGMEIADRLLKEGTITYMEDVKGKRKYFNSDEKATKIKYVVLVNENTASTSEILTAAIKDNNGGKIVGSKTFGKGIVQETTKFKDGSSLKLTVLRYFSPKGKVIHKKGIKPDVEVKFDPSSGTDNQLEMAKSLLKQ